MVNNTPTPHLKQGTPQATRLSAVKRKKEKKEIILTSWSCKAHDCFNYKKDKYNPHELCSFCEENGRFTNEEMAKDLISLGLL